MKTEILDGLKDEELQHVIECAQTLLKTRDEERKAKAIDEARAMQAKALNAAREVLAAAGLTLKALDGNGKHKAAKGLVYRGGHSYQHPANKALVWQAKGKKPHWLSELEAEGGKAIEIVPANDNAPVTMRKTG